MAKTTDAATLLKHRLGGDPVELAEQIAQEKLNVYVARIICEARAEAGLSQQALADLVDTKQQVIARLENADYDGHSLTMLQRIAKALGKKISLSFVPDHAS